MAVMEVANGTETTTAKKESNVGVPSNNGATMTFGVSLSAKTADSFDYYALYPNSAYLDTPSDFTQVKVKLASTQAPTESSFGPSADVLVAKPVTGFTAQPTELNLQFARVIAVGKMTIKNLNTTENVKKVTFTAANKAVTGRSYIDFTTAAGVEYGYSDQGVDNVILDYSDKTIAANGMTAVFTCWPFELAAGETFSVVVETENYTFTKDITLAEGKSLAFKVGRASAFNVNFAGIKGVEKAPVTQLVPDGAYVVAYDTNMMTVGASSNKYRDVATLPAKANEDGSYSVDATAAWNFVYDLATDTYQIYSAADATKYIQGLSSNSDFNLVAEADATSFTITKGEAGTYKISNGERSIGINTGTTPYRFAMYGGSTQQPVDLNLYPAKVVILPKIEVQETLSVPSAKTTSSFPVTLTNVKTADVNVYGDAECTTTVDWITAYLNTDQTAIDYVVNENPSEARTAYIKISAVSSDASKAAAIVTVTQVAAGSGAEQTWTWTAASGDLGTTTPYSTTLNEKAWTVTRSKVVYTGFSSSCIQLGSKSGAETVTLTSNAFTGTVKSVAVECSSYTGAHTVDITVGGTSYASGVSTDSWATVGTVSGTGTSSGEIVIKFNAGSRALYIKSISVTYESGSSVGGSDPVKLAAPAVSCTAQSENSLTFSWAAVTNASGYKVSVDGGSTYGDTQTATSYTWTGLSASTTKTLYVKAIGDGTNYTDSDAASASGITTAGSGVYLSEDFASLKTWGSSSKSSFDLTSGTWTASGSVYEQNGCIKIGKSTAATNNSITTPALSSISGTADVVLTFKAVSSDSGYTMSVVANNAGTVGELSPSSITQNGTAINSGESTATALTEAFAASTATFTVTITGATSATTLTIKTSDSSKRWYLDDVKVVSAN